MSTSIVTSGRRGRSIATSGQPGRSITTSGRPGRPDRPRAARGVAVAVAVVVVAIAAAACAGPAAGPPLEEAVTLVDAGASNPTVAADPRTGATYVAWVGNNGHRSQVWLASVDASGATHGPVRVNDVEGDGAPHLQAPAQVAVGPQGDVYVAWTNNVVVEGRRFPTSDLRFARSVDGGRTFESAVTVNDDAGDPPSSHTFHNLLVTSDGTVVVSWLDGRRSEGGVGDGVVTSAGAEGAEGSGDGAVPADVGATGADGGPEGAGDGVTGEAGVDPPIPGPDARVAVSTDGGRTFSASRVVDQQTCPCCRTSMAHGPGGTLYLGWRKIFEGDVRDIVVSRSLDGGASWDEPRRVHADDWVFPGCPHAGPSLAVDPAGTLHIAWYTGRPDAPGLYYAASTDRAETFGEPVTLLSDGWVPPSQVALGAGADGTIHLAWEDRRSDTPGFYYAAAAAGPVDPEQGEWHAGTNPALSSVDGRVGLAWLDGDRVHLRVGAER